MMEPSMPPRPRLSLCIPTHNRAAYLQGALESGLREAASQPAGTVEVLVCDNASTDGTPGLISRMQGTHPGLRALRNAENLGFDPNYLRSVEEARGEFVWVMGDDDVWVPGSVARVLRELDAGADACLCLAEACDLDLNPIIVLPWFLDANPPRVWRLESREDLIRYFDACARNAGAFAFISVTIFRRDRFLLHRESIQRSAGTGYPHLWGMMEYLRQPLRLHYVPEVLVRNRMSDQHADSYASMDLYGRWMSDLRGWAQVADAVFGDDAELHDAFSRIIGRNHHNTILPGLRRCSPTEAAWLDAKPYLVRAGFTPVRIAAVDLAFHYTQGDRLPMASLNPDSLCLADLPLVARGAERIAILALGLQSLLEGAALLAALRNAGRSAEITVFCPPECAELLDGFNLQRVDPKRYSKDVPYREAVAQAISGLAPELVVNLDPYRGIEADDLAASALPAGAIAFDLPSRGQDAALVKAANAAYTCLIPQDAGPEAMLEALGLMGNPPALWPAPEVQEDARVVIRELGWDPAGTLAVLVDHPSILEDPAFHSALAQTMDDGWTLLGMGVPGTRAPLERLLNPLGDRAVNFAGNLGLGPMAALLQLCGGFLGGTPLLQSMARACGCAPAPLAAFTRRSDQ
jgi:glycosyltransferase involved in cell wall biosynthesis